MKLKFSVFIFILITMMFNIVYAKEKRINDLNDELVAKGYEKIENMYIFKNNKIYVDIQDTEKDKKEIYDVVYKRIYNIFKSNNCKNFRETIDSDQNGYVIVADCPIKDRMNTTVIRNRFSGKYIYTLTMEKENETLEDLDELYKDIYLLIPNDLVSKQK